MHLFIRHVLHAFHVHEIGISYKTMCILKIVNLNMIQRKYDTSNPQPPTGFFQETITVIIFLEEALWTFITDTGKYTYNTFSVHFLLCDYLQLRSFIVLWLSIYFG